MIKTIFTLMLPIFFLIVSCHHIGKDISVNEDPAVVGKTLLMSLNNIPM
jgi:hypothetical protein